MRNNSLGMGIILSSAAAMLLFSTLPHIGACPDSAVYVGVAKNWLAGNGLIMPVVSTPLTHYPPLYPLLLSLAGFLHMDMLRWAWWMDLVFLLANIFLARAISIRLNQRNSLVTVALVALSPGILTVHWMIWSEPAFLFFGFSGLFTLYASLESRRGHFLWLSAGAIALAWLTRYSGIAFAAAACATLWLVSRKRECLIFALATGAPMSAWIASQSHQAGEIANRSIALRSINALEGTALIAEILIAWGIFLIARQKEHTLFPQLLALFLFAYTAVLAVTVCLFDPATPVFDTRIQAPVMYAGLLLLPWLANQLHKQPAKIFSRIFVALIIIQFAVSLMYTAAGYSAGLDFTDGRWVQENLSIPAHPWYQ